MSFTAFRDWLETEYVSPITSRPLGHDAPSDYASRLRTLSRLLDMDIEGGEPEALDALADTFAADARIASTQSPKAIIDMRVAVRRYAKFRRLPARASSPGTEDAGSRGDRLAEALQRLGFALTASRRHTFELRSGDCIVYVKRLSATLPIVVAPEFEVEYSRLSGAAGVIAPKTFGYYHNSQLTAFPRRLHGGKTPIPYGLDFDVEDDVGLQNLTWAILSRKDLAPSASERRDQDTETVRLHKARLGQGQFRADLFEVWRRCPLSGVATPDLLRASHIKPWRSSDRDERLDPDNGILLAIHLDCLFDKGFISLADNGEVLISAHLPQAERETFGLDTLPKTIRLRPGNIPYLGHHRAKVFLHGESARVD